MGHNCPNCGKFMRQIIDMVTGQEWYVCICGIGIRTEHIVHFIK